MKMVHHLNNQRGGYVEGSRLPRKYQEENKFYRTFVEVYEDGTESDTVYNGIDYVFVIDKNTGKTVPESNKLLQFIKVIKNLEKTIESQVQTEKETFLEELEMLLSIYGMGLTEADKEYFEEIITTALFDTNSFIGTSQGEFEYQYFIDYLTTLSEDILEEINSNYGFDEDLSIELLELIERILTNFLDFLLELSQQQIEEDIFIPRVGEPYDIIENLRRISKTKFPRYELKFQGLAWTTAAEDMYEDRCLELGLDLKDCPELEIKLRETTIGNRTIYTGEPREKTFRVFYQKLKEPKRFRGKEFTHEIVTVPIRDYTKFTKDIEDCHKTPAKGGLGIQDLTKLIQEIRPDFNLKGIKTKDDAIVYAKRLGIDIEPYLAETQKRKGKIQRKDVICSVLASLDGGPKVYANFLKS